MKAGIAIEKWKLQTFHSHLVGAGFSYTQHSGLTPDTLLLTVETDAIIPLKRVIEAAQKECATCKTKPH